MKRFVILWVAFFLLRSSAVSSQTWHTTPDKWKEARNYHTDFDPGYKDRIRISRLKTIQKPLEKKEGERNVSPNKAYWYVVTKPDTMKSGPWSTEILIYNERDYLIRIELIDYAAQYMTKIQWINEKWLYVEFWWGRALGTCFLFDVEKEKILLKEMVNDGSIPYQQWRRNGSRGMGSEQRQ